MADAQRPQGVKRRTIRGDSPSRQPPVSASAPAPAAPPATFDALDEAPTVARLPALAAAPPTRSEHPTLLGVPPPPAEALAPPVAPAFVAQPLPSDARRSPPRPVTSRPTERASPARGVLVAAVFVAAVLGALAAAKAGLDARVRSHPERQGGADPALDVGLPALRR